MNIYWYVIYMASCPDKCRDIIIGTTAILHTIWRAIVAESNHQSPHPHILLSCVLRSSHPLYDTVSLQRLLSLAWLSIELSLISFGVLFFPLGCIEWMCPGESEINKCDTTRTYKIKEYNVN